jgi:hypothetical protein
VISPQESASLVGRAEKETLVFRAADPSAFDGANDDPIHGEFGRRYFPHIHDAERTDRSFSIWFGNRPVLLVECDQIGSRLCRFGNPIRFRLADSTEGVLARRAVRAALDRLLEIMSQGRLAIAEVEDTTIGPVLSTVGEECLNRRAAPRLVVTSGIDLELDDAAIGASIRKSYRSLVNWGRRNLRLVYVNTQNPDAPAFEAYQAFHQRTAGRMTRSHASWVAMFEWIAEGGGELSLGYDSAGALVSGTLIVDGIRSAYYASGVYDRTKPHLPLGHWPLLDAILRAKHRGRSHFNLGDVPTSVEAAKKERDIAFFKRGFSTSLRTALVWMMPAPQPGDA